MTDRDRLFAAHPPVASDDDMPDRVEVRSVVADRVQLARFRVAVRMRAERLPQRAVERVVRDGVQVVVELDRRCAGFHQRPDPARVAEHVRVHRIPARIARARRGRLTERLADRIRAYPAVAVPERQSCLDPHAVHHPVAGEPVIGRRIGRRHRIRADAQITPIEFRRNRPLDLERIEGRFMIHGGVDPCQEWMRRIGCAQAIAVECSDFHRTPGHCAAYELFDCACHESFSCIEQGLSHPSSRDRS